MKMGSHKLVYCFQSIMSYGIELWGNSADNKKVFYIWSKIIVMPKQKFLMRIYIGSVMCFCLPLNSLCCYYH